MRSVQRRKRTMVEDLIKVHLGRYEASGVNLIMGEARFVAPKTVVVDLNEGGTRTITGERVILSVGTRATIPEVPGLAHARPMTHVEALDLERVPAHLIVVGGGYVGLELAQAARRFGSAVTVIEEGLNSPAVRILMLGRRSSNCFTTGRFKCCWEPRSPTSKDDPASRFA